MKIFQSNSFAKKVRKLHNNQKTDLDNAIKEILANPETGEEKRGDLKGVYVHKFKIQGTLFLLSYRFSETEIELIMLGPHENFYRALKSLLK